MRNKPATDTFEGEYMTTKTGSVIEELVKEFKKEFCKERGGEITWLRGIMPDELDTWFKESLTHLQEQTRRGDIKVIEDYFEGLLVAANPERTKEGIIKSIRAGKYENPFKALDSQESEEPNE